jgi:outer membrane lipoprotein-sorting protein
MVSRTLRPRTVRSVPLLLAATFLLQAAAAQPADVDGLLARIDESGIYVGDLSATFTLQSVDPTEGSVLRQATWFRRDVDDAFLMLIQEPTTELGQGYLNVEDGFWFYDPESRQFVYTSLSESFQGSDAKNDDFSAPSYADDYRITSLTEGTLGAYDVWIVELEATHGDATYPFKTIWVSRAEELVLKSEDYSLTERLLRTSYFPSYARIGDAYVADRMIFVDALVPGRTTEITISDLSTAELPDYIFTKAYVERVNR